MTIEEYRAAILQALLDAKNEDGTPASTPREAQDVYKRQAQSFMPAATASAMERSRRVPLSITSMSFSYTSAAVSYKHLDVYKRQFQTFVVFISIYYLQYCLVTVKIEHLPVCEIAYEMVVDVDRTAASRTSGIEQVARLEREVLANIGDDFIRCV